MKATWIVRRFDDLGRIVIPKEIRRQLFGTKCTDGEPMEIFMDKDNIILRKCKYEENTFDDVCEWKVKSNYYVTKCSHDTDVMYGLKQDFKYCPYCGKKIKVVEQMNTTEEYKGCRNCKYQPEPMQTCDWIKHQKEVYRVCPMWELKKIKVVE